MTYREYFKSICPYTDRYCNNWDCENCVIKNCVIEKEERKLPFETEKPNEPEREQNQTEQLNKIINCLSEINETLKNRPEQIMSGTGAAPNDKKKPNQAGEYKNNWFIPFEYLLQKAKTSLTETENSLLTVLEMETFGKDNKTCCLSGADFKQLTLKDEHNIRRTLYRLIERKIIIRSGFNTKMKSVWEINTNYSQWEETPDKFKFSTPKKTDKSKPTGSSSEPEQIM